MRYKPGFLDRFKRIKLNLKTVKMAKRQWFQPGIDERQRRTFSKEFNW